jgi:hypothetical protein
VLQLQRCIPNDARPHGTFSARHGRALRATYHAGARGDPKFLSTMLGEARTSDAGIARAGHVQ